MPFVYNAFAVYAPYVVRVNALRFQLGNNTTECCVTATKFGVTTALDPLH